MAKDTFWFPHDFDPTGDPKMQALLGEYGGVGYGIYWRIVEMLHIDQQHKLPMKPYIYMAIAKQMKANGKQNLAKLSNGNILPEYIKEFIQDCISTFELFESDSSFFWVNRVNRNLEKRLKISEERAKSGKRGAIAKQKLAKTSKGEERRGEKSTG